MSKATSYSFGFCSIISRTSTYSWRHSTQLSCFLARESTWRNSRQFLRVFSSMTNIRTWTCLSCRCWPFYHLKKQTMKSWRARSSCKNWAMVASLTSSRTSLISTKKRKVVLGLGEEDLLMGVQWWRIREIRAKIIKREAYKTIHKLSL